MQNNFINTDQDQSAIDKVTAAFFDLFTNTDKRLPDLTSIHSLCIPETIIIKKTGLAQEVYHIESFIAPRKKILTDGTLTNFSEKEISSETTISGHIAQRFSRYEKSGYMNGSYFKACGNKLFQLIKTADGWMISSLVWEDDVE